MAIKTWFVTGASSGFGQAFCEHALQRGYNVVATARHVAALERLVAVAPQRVLALALDVTCAQDAVASVQSAVVRFGRIDVVINNAGYCVVGAFEETPDGELRAQMETNFFGAANITRAVLPVLRAQKRGSIVNISSLGGQLSFAGFSAYSASKFALEGVSEALAREVARFGIKVLIVEPGQFRTNLAGNSMRHMPVLEAYRAVIAETRNFARNMHGAQEGDPRKAAAAIEAALDSPNTPLRLQLGADSIDAIRDHSESLLKDLAAWEAAGRATALNEVSGGQRA
jgi:NAD(P)-dependent dehydrogenase (short-subunit alcohol dehydrogenase family)